MHPKPTSTKRTTLFKMHDSATLDSAVSEGRRTSNENFTYQHVVVDGQPGRLVSGVQSSTSKWTGDITLLTGKALTLESSSPGAALVLEDRDGRIWAITWGIGFQFLDMETVDYGFGARIVGRSAIADDIKSITKTVLDHRARVDRSSTPSGSTIRDLGVDGYGEVVSRIEARAVITDLAFGDRVFQIRAADSINLPLSKSSEGLLLDLEAIASLEGQPVLKGMESLEQLIALKPRDSRVSILEAELAAAIERGDERLGLSWPQERLDIWGPVESCKVTGVGDRVTRSYDGVPDIAEVLSWLTALSPEVVADRLKTIKLELHNSASPEKNTLVSAPVPLRRWLAFEILKDDQRFCLHDGQWYRMDDKYLDRVDERVNEILSIAPPLQLPAWPEGENERDYNIRAAGKVNGLTIDRKLITTPLHSRGGIEPCDIYVDPGILVHVKRGRSSADLSHLLAQALVSTDSIARDEFARTAWRQRLADESKGEVTEGSILSVVIAIGRREPVTTESMFTFTKVNLVKQYDALRFLEVGVSVITIPED